MDAEKLRSLFEKYDRLLEEDGRKVERFDAAEHGNAEGDLFLAFERHGSEEASYAALDHVRDMIARALNLNFTTDRREKAMRWLGFIQGALWVTGRRTLEELKRDSMPAGADYEAQRD